MTIFTISKEQIAQHGSYAAAYIAAWREIQGLGPDAVPERSLTYTYYVYRRYLDDTVLGEIELMKRYNTECARNRPKRAAHYAHTAYKAGKSNSLTNLFDYCERRTLSRVIDDAYEGVPDDFPVKHGTGVHISTNDPSMLAFYPTLEHIKCDRPQLIRPGRYIKKYFPEMSDDVIRMHAARICPSELKFFNNWEDMRDAYLALNDVVESCMSKDSWGDKHPLMVYHNSDVELAVLYVQGKPVARALYNKQTRQYPMVYGQWERMKHALDAVGFEHGDLDGARINRIDRHGLGMENNGSDELLMPYIDGHRELDRSHNNSTKVYVYDTYCEISQYGDYEANDYTHVTLALHSHKCECCGDSVSADYTTYLEHEEISVCGDCYSYNCVTIYAERRGNDFVVTEEYAQRNYTYVEPVDQWFENSSAAAINGWLYSNWHDDYLNEDDAVWVESVDDYVHYDQLGTVFVYIDEDAVDIDYVDPSKTYWNGTELVTDGSEDERLDQIRGKYADRPTNFPAKLWGMLPINESKNNDIFDAA